MKDSVHIQALALDVTFFGQQMKIFPVLIWDHQHATLIDTAFPGQFPQLAAAIQQAGVSLQKISQVIITHQDWDHIGTIPNILKASGSPIEILAHSAEKPYLEGTLPYIKLTPERIAARIQSLPEEYRQEAIQTFGRIPTTKITRGLADHEILPLYGGLEVIHTPGHTPGHICLYLKTHRTLIAGDELRVENGQLQGPVAQHSTDMPAALASLKKLTPYDIDTVICYHGGPFGPNANAAIAKLAAQ
jgi:glyoxylase-like metal-dependent hydrolase (beta-lactamase superfamily II)